tara:strand:- start:585 stop:965 length:381 start_codon:yes stop_codon:yes gene_type:complete
LRKTSDFEPSPAFQFYASDWISNSDVLKLSLEEQGAFVRLFCYCWRSYRILNDTEVLAKMCNCRLSKMESMLPNLEKMFIKQKGDDGKEYLICSYAEEERRIQKNNRRKKSLAGRKGASVRWGDNE